MVSLVNTPLEERITTKAQAPPPAENVVVTVNPALLGGAPKLGRGPGTESGRDTPGAAGDGRGERDGQSAGLWVLDGAGDSLLAAALGGPTMHKPLVWMMSSMLLLSLGRAGLAAPAAPLWGLNLMPNPSLEEVDDQGRPQGWTLAHHGANKGGTLGVSPEACAGQRCLMMDFPAEAGKTAEGLSNQAFGPLVPTEEGWYLVSCWVRADYPADVKPDGPAMFYLLHRGGPDNQQNVGPAAYCYYGSMADLAGQWRYAFVVVHQGPGQTAMQLQIPHQAAYRMLVDAIRVRRLLPPEVKQPLSVNEIRDSYYGGELVKDPDTSTGLAWKVTEGLFPSGSKIMGGGSLQRTAGPVPRHLPLQAERAGQAELAADAVGRGGAND